MNRLGRDLVAPVPESLEEGSDQVGRHRRVAEPDSTAQNSAAPEDREGEISGTDALGHPLQNVRGRGVLLER
jgi:hypothetical protein